MGRRSRKRAADTTTRAERDAARRARASATGTAGRSRPRAGRPTIDERPPAPWGSFPLSELLVLVGLVLIGWGIFSGKGHEERLAAGIVVAALGGAELALREHLGGYRSHTTLLAGRAAFAGVTCGAPALRPAKLWVLGLSPRAVFGYRF